MMTVAEAFEIFRQRLELSETESNDAKRRNKDVRECMRAKFDIDRDFLTGSYENQTNSRTIDDVCSRSVQAIHWPNIGRQPPQATRRPSQP